jgi:peptide/nickel transport system substrate-binding protein/oligopeptide transport system substrate-binding protein
VKISRKIITTIAVLIVLIMIGTMFSGCKKQSTTETTTAEAASSAETTAAAETTVTETTTIGGIMRVSIFQPVSLDPPFCVESEGIQVIRQIWDGLFDYDSETLELVPELCDKWEVSNDGLVYTFYLKKGVKFHDGSPLTAEDFVYSWTRAVLKDTAAPLVYHFSPVKGFDACQDGSATTLEGVKAIDGNTLQVTLSYPYADFVTTLGHVAFYPVKEADIVKWGADYSKHINGTGPFKFVEWIDDQHINLDRNDDYYGQKAMLDAIEYKIFADDSTALLEFKAGNIDLTLIPRGEVKATQEDPKYKDYTIIKPMLGIYYYGMNLQAEPFKDNSKLREAINYLIDRKNICEVLNEGVPTPMTGFVPPGIPGFQENAAPYTYDPEKAKQLLSEAGYPDGKGLPTLTWVYDTGSGHEIIGEAIQADFKSVGIKMELEGYEWGTFLDKAKAGDFTFYRQSWQADYPTMDNFLYPLFDSKAYDNYTFYNNPDVDRMLLEARSTIDNDKRIAKYREIEKKVLSDNAFVLIFFYGQRRVIQPNVKGFILDSMGNYDLSKVYLGK